MYGARKVSACSASSAFLRRRRFQTEDELRAREHRFDRRGHARLEVPLDALLAHGQPEVRYVSFRKRRYPAYFYRYRDYEIWGLTGRIVKSLLDLVWMSL